MHLSGGGWGQARWVQCTYMLSQCAKLFFGYLIGEGGFINLYIQYIKLGIGELSSGTSVSKLTALTKSSPSSR